MMLVCEVLSSREACSCDRVPGRLPKLNGHIPGHLGALCHWQESHSPGDKSISHKKDFITTISRYKNYIVVL